MRITASAQINAAVAREKPAERLMAQRGSLTAAEPTSRSEFIFPRRRPTRTSLFPQSSA